jgi:hypothetical protein
MESQDQPRHFFYSFCNAISRICRPLLYIVHLLQSVLMRVPLPLGFQVLQRVCAA